MRHDQQHYETVDISSRTTNDQFVDFDRYMKMYPPRSSPRFNPTPLGLCAFALTLFVLSMYNAGVGIPVTASPGAAMGLGVFYGGLIQLIAGLLEFRNGNNFGGLAFCSYGGFWLALSSLYIGSFNFLGFNDTPTDSKALGIFFLAWTIFTAAMLVASLRTNIALISFFASLTLTFILLTACKFQHNDYNLQRAAGAFGILTSIITWYAGFASLLKKGENSYFSLPMYDLTPKTSMPIDDKPSTTFKSIRSQKI